MPEHLIKTAFHPFPELETERLLLTRMDLRFVEQKFALRTNLDVMRYFDRPLPASLEEVRAKVEEGVQSVTDGKALLWAILHKETRPFLGDVGYWRLDPDHAVAEIGYALMPDHWRKGIMCEALTVVLPFAF